MPRPCPGKRLVPFLIFAEISGIGSLTFVTQCDPPETSMVTDVLGGRHKTWQLAEKAPDSYQGMPSAIPSCQPEPPRFLEEASAVIRQIDRGQSKDN
jgi:hypothetical protein